MKLENQHLFTIHKGASKVIATYCDGRVTLTILAPDAVIDFDLPPRDTAKIGLALLATVPAEQLAEFADEISEPLAMRIAAALVTPAALRGALSTADVGAEAN